MDNYRRIPRVANSDLSELKNFIFNNPYTVNSPALAFGTHFHDLLLMNTHMIPTGKGATALCRMLDVLRANSLFCRLMETGQPEQPQFWENEQTGLLCKARIDLCVPDENLIVDIKTTSARTQAEFVSNCYRYEYDRQTAYYLDGYQRAGNCADRFLILGIQKQKPHNLYVEEVLADSIFVDNGRRKYQRLLRSWKEIGFRPTSWKS